MITTIDGISGRRTPEERFGALSSAVFNAHRFFFRHFPFFSAFEPSAALVREKLPIRIGRDVSI